MRSFMKRRDTLLTRTLLLLLIASAFDVLTMLVIPLIRDDTNFLAAPLFHPWVDARVLIGTAVAGLVVAAYIYLTTPYQSRRARQIFASLVGVLTTLHFIAALWNLALLANAIRITSGS